MTVTINDTKNIFKKTREDKIKELIRLMGHLIIAQCKPSCSDLDSYQQMSALKISLKPFTVLEETDILISIQTDKRFYWED